MTDTLTDERLREIEARIDDAANEQDGGLSQAILEANAVEDLLLVFAALRSERKAREAAEVASYKSMKALSETISRAEAAEAEVERLREAWSRLADSASALLKHFNPVNLAEDASQQWQSVFDQIYVFNPLNPKRGGDG